jgi:hypothetical protein
VISPRRSQISTRRPRGVANVISLGSFSIEGAPQDGIAGLAPHATCTALFRSRRCLGVSPGARGYWKIPSRCTPHSALDSVTVRKRIQQKSGRPSEKLRTDRSGKARPTISCARVGPQRAQTDTEFPVVRGDDVRASRPLKDHAFPDLARTSGLLFHVDPVVTLTLCKGAVAAGAVRTVDRSPGSPAGSGPRIPRWPEDAPAPTWNTRRLRVCPAGSRGR